MGLKKRLGVQILVLLLAVVIWSGFMLTSAAALPDQYEPQYTIKVEYYCEETDTQIRYMEMVIGVDASANLMEAIQAELGADWLNLYQDEYHQDGQLASNIQDAVTNDVTVKVFYPLETFTSSASRL